MKLKVVLTVLIVFTSVVPPTVELTSVSVANDWI
jgi:hypothetical protein